MNAKRRRQLKEVCDFLNKAADTLECVIDDEQDSLDNTPENLQFSESYGDREEKIGDMMAVLDDIKSCSDSVSDFAI